MPTPQKAAAESKPLSPLHRAALERLKQGSNPFIFSVATAGTEEDCLRYDIPEFFKSQQDDLHAVVDLYRGGKQDSQLFPVIGDIGVGKTHLLNTFQNRLNEASQQGKDVVVIVAKQLPVSQDAIEFLRNQIVNYLLSQSPSSNRVLRSISHRLVARLLGTALRKLPPQQQATLFPAKGGLWQTMLNSLGGTQAKTDTVAALAKRFDEPMPDVRTICQVADLPLERAVELVRDHLKQSEPNDAVGYFRKELYGRLAAFALLENRVTLDDFLIEEYKQGPTHVIESGPAERRLLTALLEVFRSLGIPLVVVFDQLEEALRGPDQQLKPELADAFIHALAAMVDKIPNLCLVSFAERGLWNQQILQRIPPYAAERLNRRFSLPNQPAKFAIQMPDSVGHGHLSKLISKRIREKLGNFEGVKELPDIFPFSESQLRLLEEKEPTFRRCLRKLSEWYDQLVFVGPIIGPGPDPVTPKLKAQWQAAKSSAKKKVPDLSGPDFHAALEVYLAKLRELAIPATAWTTTELVSVQDGGMFDLVSVIRDRQPEEPGVGLAAWFAGGAWPARDLQAKLEFFKANPCPIRTLVLFRTNATTTARGRTISGKTFQDAIAAGLDLRLHDVSEAELVNIIAFPEWLQAIDGIVTSAPEHQAELKKFVADISADLLKRIETWSKPSTPSTK